MIEKVTPQDIAGFQAPSSKLQALVATRARQLSAGIYNLLKSGRNGRGMTVDRFLSRVNTSNEDVEANILTIFMSVRGTKQYWFLRNSELKCMVREWGTPTLFLTFSCAEYESPEILGYLKKVNIIIPPVGCAPKIRSRFRASFPKRSIYSSRQ